MSLSDQSPTIRRTSSLGGVLSNRASASPPLPHSSYYIDRKHWKEGVKRPVSLPKPSSRPASAGQLDIPTTDQGGKDAPEWLDLDTPLPSRRASVAVDSTASTSAILDMMELVILEAEELLETQIHFYRNSGESISGVVERRYSLDGNGNATDASSSNQAMAFSAEESPAMIFPATTSAAIPLKSILKKSFLQPVPVTSKSKRSSILDAVMNVAQMF
ncbi:hypothetical protein BC830DRAFT_1092279 [Chytriomyces sp. MP71]|nr:hypothetical protein BC830DRAFT_1092279 [Chytriomyces sp. MP71]